MTENTISVRTLASKIAPMEETEETVIQLHHSTLPRLTEAGIIEYDSSTDTVQYYEMSGLEELLDAVIDCFPGERQFSGVGP